MTALTLFGLCAVLFMLFCYMMEPRSAWWTLAFAGGCALSAIYGLLQGAWPFALAEGLWTIVALRRWRQGIARA